MLQFLIPVDFSDASANALRYAFELNKHFIAKLHVLHVFDVPFSASPETDTAVYEYESIRQSFTERTWKFIGDHKGDFHFDVEVFVTSGGHFQEVVEYARTHNISMIILGNKGKSGLGRLFYGTVTQNLLRKAPCPTLSIPAQFPWNPVHDIVVCTDYSEPLTDQQCEALKMLSDRLEAGLRFLHVQDKVEVALPEDNIAKQKIKTFFGKDPVVTPFAETIPHSIEQYMNAEGGDWVVTIPHQHSWLDHFLLGSETASISEHLKLPLLALH
jgi:nucleotide-binding universal stress UspA family protein